MGKSLRIRLDNQEFLLLGTLAGGGAIATEEQYKHGRVSYAHLYSDGTIMRFHEAIGTRADIEVLGEVPTPQPAADAWENILSDEEWGA